MDHTYYDFAAFEPVERYRIMANAITPRPIAFITTRSADGVANAAPFSFFGLLSHDPATLAVGIEPRLDGRRKDTAQNILETGVFTVHIADVALAAQMDACGAPVEPDVDELSLSGLPVTSGQNIDVPRILTAPLAMECRLHSSIELGPARDVIIGSILGLFVRSTAVDADGRFIQQELDVITRVGGGAYATSRDLFSV